MGYNHITLSSSHLLWGLFFSYWISSPSPNVMICVYFYCNLLGCVWLISLGSLNFSEEKWMRSGGEERWW